MTNIFLAPGFLRNIRRSLIEGVRFVEITVKDDRLSKTLRHKYADEAIKLWGVKEKPVFLDLWRKAEKGDYVLFYNNKVFIYLGRILFIYPFLEKDLNQVEVGNELAESVWGKDVDGKTWPFLLFLSDVGKMNVSLNRFNELLEYKLKALRRFSKVSDSKVKWLEKKHGGIESFMELLTSIKPPTRPAPIPEHDKIIDMIYELGEVIGYKPERKKKHKAFIYDVLWYKPRREEPACVFEVHLKGNLHKSLLGLTHAYGEWKSQLFLVSTEEQLRKTKEEFLVGDLYDLFEEKILALVKISEIEEFCQFKGKFEWLERRFGLRLRLIQKLIQ